MVRPPDLVMSPRLRISGGTWLSSSTSTGRPPCSASTARSRATDRSRTPQRGPQNGLQRLRPLRSRPPTATTAPIGPDRHSRSPPPPTPRALTRLRCHDHPTERTKPGLCGTRSGSGLRYGSSGNSPRTAPSSLNRATESAGDTKGAAHFRLGSRQRVQHLQPGSARGQDPYERRQSSRLRLLWATPEY